MLVDANNLTFEGLEPVFFLLFFLHFQSQLWTWNNKLNNWLLIQIISDELSVTQLPSPQLQKMNNLLTHSKHPSIDPLSITANPMQPIPADTRVAQLITGLTYRDKQPYTRHSKQVCFLFVYAVFLSLLLHLFVGCLQQNAKKKSTCELWCMRQTRSTDVPPSTKKAVIKQLTISDLERINGKNISTWIHKYKDQHKLPYWKCVAFISRWSLVFVSCLKWKKGQFHLFYCIVYGGWVESKAVNKISPAAHFSAHPETFT